MTTPQPPLPPDQRLAVEQRARYEKFARNVAIGGVIICPMIALMPPRKIDLYTFSLSIGFYLSADHLVKSYTGRGLIDNTMRARLNPVPDLPTEKAREMHQKLKEKELLEKGLDGTRKAREERTVWHKLWMGDEPDDWKEKRMVEERKALEEGKTYTGMILDQIWEVWNWDKKKDREREDNEQKKP